MKSTVKTVALQSRPQNVVSMNPRGVPRMDLNSIAALRQELGQNDSQEIVERAAFELSDRLYLLNLAMSEKDHDQVGRMAKSIVAISEQIGLTEFSIAARNLSECILLCDVNAIAAVHARVANVGEMSLVYAVELCEIPI